MIAWARTASILLGALAMFAGAAAQLVAALIAYHPALGEGIAEVGGVRFYPPWEVARWAFHWAPHRPWLALLIVVLIGACFLAALAIAALASAVEPTSLIVRRSPSGYERWDTLSQRGRLGASDLALGAMCRHGLARPDFIRHEHGHVLLLGDPKLTGEALIASISCWTGAIVFIDVANLSSKLARHNVVRFAPGRADSIALNPLLNIRGGAHAWSDARLLARAFLRTSDAVLVDAFAALMFDTLATAPIAMRSLAGLRQRLTNPTRRLNEMCARWSDGAYNLGPATGELARVVRSWRRDGEGALRAFSVIDAALGLFANGDYVLATEAHQLRFGDLVASDAPECLIIAPPASEGARAAPLVAALLAQLVAACGPSSDLDQLGRRKLRRLLIVVEAEALAGLVAERKEGTLSAAVLRGATECGCTVLVQARCAKHVAALLGESKGDVAAQLRSTFAAKVAIGPQSEATAKALSDLAGPVETWKRVTTFRGVWLDWLAPKWERTAHPITSAEELRAGPEEELLLLNGFKPIRCAPIAGGEGRPIFIAPDPLAPAPHDWSAPPFAASEAPLLEARPSPLEGAPSTLASSSSKLRRALARRTVPQVRRAEERLL